MTFVVETATQTLRLSRVYSASREVIYKAWTNPEILGRWFGPHSHRCQVEKLDVREGGEYQIRMIPIVDDSDCGGDSTQDSVCGGKFVSLKAAEEIVMTFDWIENGFEMGPTLLTIKLTDTDNGTRLDLVHEKIPTVEAADAHKGGWEGSLECLQEYLATG